MENIVDLAEKQISENADNAVASSIHKHICKLCEKQFEWKSGLSRHIKTFHLANKLKSYTCNICNQSFHKQVGLTLHLKLHEKCAMKTTPNAINNKQKQKISELYSNIISETVYSSDSDCEYEVLQTIVKVKSDAGSQCKFCWKTFIKSESMQRHLNKHKDIFNNKTDQSETSGVQDSISENDSDPDHNGISERVSNPKPEKYCDKCDKSFKSSCNLTNHLKMHLKQSVAMKKHRNTVLLGKETYPCNLCNKVYLKQMHLENHMLVHEKDVGASAAPDKVINKQHLCMVCGKAYTRSSHLSVHMRTHMEFKPHLCSVCGKSFTIRRYLIVHQRIHTREKPFVCQHCNKGFIQKGNLVEHLRTHSGVKPHCCATCGKQFTHYSGLTQHLLTHSSVKKHCCNICDKAFRLASHHREHMRIHSGDRPYVCRVCARAFANSSSLVVHLRTHSGERPYRCQTCKKGFIKSYGLKQHMKTNGACRIGNAPVSHTVAENTIVSAEN